MNYRISKLQWLVVGTTILIVVLGALLKSVRASDDFYQMRLLELQLRESEYDASIDSAVFIALEIELAHRNAALIAEAQKEADRLVALERARIKAVREAALRRRSNAPTARKNAPKATQSANTGNTGANTALVAKWERQRDNFDYSKMSKAQAAFVRTWFVTAKGEQNKYGIPASVKMAQAMIESGVGTSYLARNANNFFGIKKGRGWTGEIEWRHDDDYDSKGRRIKSPFRKYRSGWYSWRDHSVFLSTNQRYSRLFDLGAKDYRGWARGLKRAGYATGANYDGKIIRFVESLGLQAMD